MRMIRGDSAKYSFIRHNLAGEVITAEPFAVYFTVKNSFDAEDFILQKKLGDGIEFDGQKYTLTLDPSDTESLAYGSYVFDIEVIQDAQETYKKTIKRGKFILEGESTWKINENTGGQ